MKYEASMANRSRSLVDTIPALTEPSSRCFVLTKVRLIPVTGRFWPAFVIPVIDFDHCSDHENV